MPTIPVIGINYDQAKDILQNFTNAKGIAKTFYYGLPLNTSVERNFTAKVEVYRNENVVTLNNVIGTIRGRYVSFMIKHKVDIMIKGFSQTKYFLVKISRKVEEILFQRDKTEKPYEWRFEVRAKRVLQISHE